MYKEKSISRKYLSLEPSSVFTQKEVEALET